MRAFLPAAGSLACSIVRFLTGPPISPVLQTDVREGVRFWCIQPVEALCSVEQYSLLS